MNSQYKHFASTVKMKLLLNVFFPKFPVFREREASRLQGILGAEGAKRPVSRKFFCAEDAERPVSRKCFGDDGYERPVSKFFWCHGTRNVPIEKVFNWVNPLKMRNSF